MPLSSDYSVPVVEVPRMNAPEGFLTKKQEEEVQAVLVLHAWWGLTDTIRDFCRRLAGEGFTAFAPDLYHGKVARTIPEAEVLGKALDEDFQQAKAEVTAAAEYLIEQTGQAGSGLAVIGFSLGAYYALDLSAAHPDLVSRVVIFYGSGGGIDFSRSRAAYLGHFAEQDPFEPLDGVRSLEDDLRRAGCPVTFYVYPETGHWFFEPDRSDAYQPEAAQLAWSRTLEFLKAAVP